MTERTIDLTPTNGGFTAIAKEFSDQIIKDTKKARQPHDKALLAQVILIAAALGQRNETALVNELVKYVDPTYLPRKGTE